MKNRVLAFCVCCVIAWWAIPNLTHPTTLPNGADIPFHYWRTFSLGYNWSQGDGFARWSTLYNLGYGGVAFQFTAPAFYALANVIGLLTGVGIPLQMKWAWYLAAVMGCWGVWRFSFQRWGMLPSYYAVVAWASSPILVKFEPLVRGSFGVVLGLGGLLLALSYLDDVLHKRGGFLPTVVSVAVLMLAHNLTTVLGMVILIGWLAWQMLTVRQLDWRSAMLALGCGGMLGMWFWLPVLFELEWVSMHRLQNDPTLDYRLFFTQVSQLFLPPQPYYPTLLNNGYTVHLGVLQGVGAGLGVVLWLWKGRSHALEPLYWAGCVGVGIVLATPLSAPVWQASEFLQTFQFPPRFLMWAMLGGVMLGSYGIFELLSVMPRLGQGVGAVAIGGLLLVGRMEAQWGEATFALHPNAHDYLQMELEHNWRGTTASGEFLPNTVLEMPPPTAFVLDSLSANQPSQRFNPYAYPDVQFEVIRERPNYYQLKINTPAPFTLELLQLGQTGWRTLVDGKPLDNSYSVPFGFPLIPIEIGEHILERVYPVSSWQALGRAIALGGGMLAVFVGWRSRRGGRALPIPTSPPKLGYIACLLVVIIAIKWMPSSPPSIPEGRVASFANDAHLQDYRITEVLPRQVWRVELTWAAPSKPVDFNLFVHLLDENGHDVLQHDKLDVRLEASHSMRDVYYLVADAPLSRADYRIRVGMWRCLDSENTFACGNRAPISATLEGQPANLAGWLILQP